MLTPREKCLIIFLYPPCPNCVNNKANPAYKTGLNLHIRLVVL